MFTFLRFIVLASRSKQHFLKQFIILLLVYFSYENPIEFQRGDEIKVTCGFKTKDRPTTTFKGDGTADEMCYGFFTFYPAENIPVPYCTAWKSLDRNRAYYGQVNGCNVFGFVNASHPDTMRLHQKVLSHCSHLGLCLKECKDVIKEVKRTEPCIQGDLNDFFRDIARTDAKYIQMGPLLLSDGLVQQGNGAGKLPIATRTHGYGSNDRAFVPHAYTDARLLFLWAEVLELILVKLVK